MTESHSVFRRPFGAVDDEHRHWPARRFQSQTELLLHRREQAGFRGIVRARWLAQNPAELRLVRSPFQIEVVAAGNAGFVDHGPVERGPLKYGREFAYGSAAAGQANELRRNHKNERRRAFRRRVR